MGVAREEMDVARGRGTALRQRAARRALVALAPLILTACPEAQDPAGPPARAGSTARVVYDANRIPHVLAETDADAFFGLGYQAVRDFPVATLANLWSATGRFAEVAGAAVLGRDEAVLALGVDEVALAQAEDDARLDPGVRALSEAYVAGVEAGRAWWLAHPDAIESLADGGAMHVDPVPAWLDKYLARDDTSRRLARLFSQEVTLHHVLSLGVAVSGGAELMGGGYALTNVWAVSNGGDEPTTSLTVDSHQPIKRAGARAYLVQVSGASYDVAGYTMPGYPCIVLGFGRTLAFSTTSLPQAPRRIMEAGDVPFRFLGAAPVVDTAWEAELEPEAPARLRVGEREVPLVARTLTLRYWDVERGALVDDPRGPLTFHRVPETDGELAALGVAHAVVEPAPGAPIDPTKTRRIRFEGKSFLAARNAFEFWTRVGLASHVGPGTGGLDEVFEDVLLCFGRGQAFQAVDAGGGMQFLWSSLVPIPGPRALELAPWKSRAPAPLDGNDVATRWRGLHRFEDLPRMLDTTRGDAPEVWVNANDSPHAMRAAGFDDARFEGREYVLERRPWKTLRHDRARALLARAAADGRVTSAEIEAAALDVQDPWAVHMWPLMRALRDVEGAGGDVRELLDWIERFRFEDAAGTPGEEPFLAHPMSQVTVFTSLVHHAFEARVLALDPPREHETALPFDPFTPAPRPEAFAHEPEWERCRAALLASLSETARVFAATRDGAAGGIGTREMLAPLVERAVLAGPWSEDAWRALLDDRPHEAWGADAPRVPVRWGQAHLYALTPHARRVFAARLFERALPTVVDPASVKDGGFHASMDPVVFPAGGTADSIFQLHAEGFRDPWDALFERGEQRVLYLPIDFGSQLLWSVELRPDAPPRARFLASMGSTEITRALPAAGVRGGDHVRTVEAFAAGRWDDLPTEREAVEAAAARTITLVRDAEGALVDTREGR